jgi:succinate dehydrogenase hydrophobic anchor subunit
VKEVDGLNAAEVERLRGELAQAHILICNAVAVMNGQVHRDQASRDAWNGMRKWLVDYADSRSGKGE